MVCSKSSFPYESHLVNTQKSIKAQTLPYRG